MSRRIRKKANSPQLKSYSQSFIEQSHEAVIIFDEKFQFYNMNERAERIIGYNHEEMHTMVTFELVTMIEERQMLRGYLQATMQGRSQLFECIIKHKNKKLIELSAKTVPIVVNNNIVGMYFIFKDITLANHMLLELEETKDLLESFISHASEGIIVVDINGKILRVNEAYEHLFGWSKEEILGHNIMSIPWFFKEDIGLMAEKISLQQYPITLDAERIQKDGSHLYVAVTISPVKNHEGEIIGFAAIHRDVSERKAMEQALRESDAVYRLITENMSDVISLIDAKGIVRYISPSSETVTGYSQHQIEGTLCYDWLDSAASAFLKQILTGAEAELQIDTCEFEFTRADGILITMEAHVTPVYDQDKVMNYVSIVVRDITARKKAEIALAEAETKYRVLVEEAMVGVYLFQDGHLIYANPRFCDMLGYTLDEIVKVPVIDMMHADHRDDLQNNVKSRITGITKSIAYNYRMLCKDGSIIDVEGNGSYTCFNGKSAIIGTCLEVTERRKTDEILRRSDRLTVVGQLAAGIAHEIRNPLTSLKGFVHLLKARNSEYREYLDIMSSELDRINYIVSEFMLIAKPQSVKFQPQNITFIMNDVLSLLGSQAALYNVQFVLSSTSSYCEVMCDEHQIKQVFINILKNAIEAMPNGGAVDVEFSVEVDNFVLIRITDHGEGISDDRIAQLGEPFFTTKEKGTGLGLMVCYKIIESHQGSIEIRSVVHRGTTVDIYLPLSQ